MIVALCGALAADARGDVVLSSGTPTIRGTFMFDFESGLEQTAGADFWWEIQTLSPPDSRIVVQNGAGVVRLPGGTDFGALTASQLAAMSYGTTRYGNPAVGQVFAFRTNVGNFAKMLVTAVSYPSTGARLTVQFVTYAPREQLHVTAPSGGTITGPNGLSCPTTCNVQLPINQNVTLQANPGAGNRLVSWGGDCSGSNATCSLNMNGVKNVSATFGVATFELSVAKSGSGSGTVASAPGTINCGSACVGTFNSGTSVTLTATPAHGSYFAGWGGACSGTAPTCTVRVTDKVSATATFVHPSLTVGDAKVAARWSTSRLTGTLTVSGSASNGADLTVTLRRRATRVQMKATVGDGAFTQTFKLPARLAPGKYRMEVAGTSHGVDLEQVARPVTVPAPPEGVVRRAYTTGAKNGRPTRTLRHGAKEVWAVFEFAAKPRPRLLVTVSWYLNGRRVGVRPAHRKLFVVAAGISYGNGVPSGRWTIRLSVGGKLVGVASVKVA